MLCHVGVALRAPLDAGAPSRGYRAWSDVEDDKCEGYHDDAEVEQGDHVIDGEEV